MQMGLERVGDAEKCWEVRIHPNRLKKFRNPIADYKKIIKLFKLYDYYNTKIENLSSGSIQKLRLIISFYSDSNGKWCIML